MYILDNLLIIIIDIFEYQKLFFNNRFPGVQQLQVQGVIAQLHRDQRGYLCNCGNLTKTWKNKGPKESLPTEGRTAQKTCTHYSFSA